MAIKKNYKNKHYLIIASEFIVVILSILPSFLSGSLISVLQIIPAILFCGPYEKVDELVEVNLNRANKFTMILLIALLMLFYFLSNNNVTLTATSFGIAACFAIGFRSILFLWFDRTPDVVEDEL